jgi:hypothetical protein
MVSKVRVVSSTLARPTLWCGPSRHLSIKVDTNDLGRLELPRDIGHNIDGIRTSNTTSNHTETTSVRSVRIGTDHHQSWSCVVLKDDLVAEVS